MTAFTPESFESNVRDPENWVEKGRALRECANVVYSSFVTSFTTAGQGGFAPGYLMTAHMLFGMALESGLKGRIVRDDPGAVKIDHTGQETRIEGFRGVRGDGHDLVRLAAIAGLASRKDADLMLVLQDLTRCMRWMARYPVPRVISTEQESPATTKLMHKSTTLPQWIKPMLDELLGEAR